MMKQRQKNKEILRFILAVSMVITGILHFAVQEPFVKIVPDFLPYPVALVYLRGICEIVGVIGLLIPSVSHISAWGLVILYIAVNHIHIQGIPDSPWFQAIRLPFQAVLIAWAYWYNVSSTKLKSC